MPSRNTIEIVINATDNASGVFGKLTDNTQSLGKSIALGITAGLATASVAIAGFAAKGIAEFTSFEQGIKEVFTLIPDASQQMKEQLSDDIQYLADRFGILTEDQIPALYQALSAGIPPDNIFEFLTTANKAAVGGVVNLESAVDGITSVLNAYGLSADKASNISDIMFTGIRLGKTTFTELSASLFQVIPSASALGVSFGDVTAALASITSQGTPTSVATTQLRQLFIELSKAGGKAADTFQELSGKTFKDFIAGGGNVQDALKIMEQGANASGLSISDMFSSVEAGNAALQLTGKGAERFTNFIDQMSNSAGAADKAFETMSDTIQFQSNRAMAKLQNLFIEVGRKFAPMATQAFEDFGDVVSLVTGIITGEFTKQSASYEDIINDFGALKPLAVILIDIGDEIRRVTGIVRRFFAGVRGGVPFLANLKSMMYALFPKSTADAINVIINGLNTLWMAIKPIVDSVIKFITENVKLEDVLIAIGIAIASFVIPAIISIAAAIAPIIITFGLLVGAVTLLRKAWEDDFGGIRTFVLEKLIPALQTIADWFMNSALPSIIDFVQNTALPAIKTFFNWLGETWEKVRPGLEALATWFINDALPAIINFINTSVIPAISTFVGILLGIWNTVSPYLDKLYNWFVTEALPALVRFIEGTVVPGITTLSDTIYGIWEVVRPELEKFAAWFLTDALPKIKDFILNTVLPALGELLKVLVNLWNTVAPELGKILTWFVTGTGLKDISQAVTEFADLFAENSSLLKGLAALIGLLAIGGSGGVGIVGLLTGMATAMKGVLLAALPVAGALGLLVLATSGLVDAVKKFNEDVGNAAVAAGVDLAERIQSGLTSKKDIADTVFAELQKQYGDLGARLIQGSGIIGIDRQVELVYQSGLNYGRNLNEGMADGFRGNTQLLLEQLQIQEDAVKNHIETGYDMHSPSQVFFGYGENLIKGLTEGLESIFPQITEKLTAMKTMVVNFMNQLKIAVTTNMTSIVSSFTSGFTMILTVFTNIVPKITTQVNSIISVLNQLKISIASTLAAVSSVSSTMANASLPTSTGSLAYANGLPYAPRNMNIGIHQGERVLTKDENKAYSNGQNQSNSPMINIENLVLGDIANQSDANEKARMFVNGLRAQGMEI